MILFAYTKYAFTLDVVPMDSMRRDRFGDAGASGGHTLGEWVRL